jgi:hypothetical protein
MTTNEINDLTRQSQKLIAEAKRLRLRLEQAIEEFEEVCVQAERQRSEAYRRRISGDDHNRPGSRIRR